MTRGGGRPLALVLAALAALAGACEPDPQAPPAPEPLLPEDWAARYTEVRPCMPSGDHDLDNVRIVVDDAALGPYLDRDAPFPVGAVVVKPQYDFGDTTCSGDIVRWTIMVKREAGSAPDQLDWHWQTIDPDRTVVDEDLPRCIACHTGCGVPPDGYDGTCAILP